MSVHHRQQEFVALSLPADATSGADDAPSFVGSEIFPPRRNIRLFSADFALSTLREFQDLCGRGHRDSSIIPVSWENAESHERAFAGFHAIRLPLCASALAR